MYPSFASYLAFCFRIAYSIVFLGWDATEQENDFVSRNVKIIIPFSIYLREKQHDSLSVVAPQVVARWVLFTRLYLQIPEIPLFLYRLSLNQ